MSFRNNPRKTLQQKLEEKFIPEPNSGCWLWFGAAQKAGYGIIGSAGGHRGTPNAMAHRVAWEIYRGPIPCDYDIDHLCRNPSCVNPDHLEPTTRQVNLLRGVTVPASNAAKTHCSKGHEYSAGNTYYYAKTNSRQCVECRRERDRKRKAIGRLAA